MSNQPTPASGPSRREFLAGALALPWAAGPGAPHVKLDATTAADALDEGLTLLADTGPEFGGGLANHGPMAIEALVAMGRPAAVLPWVERYRRRLRPAPKPGTPLDAASWAAALGDRSRYPAWEATFARELAEQPWPEVVRAAVPKLVPGLMGALAHGVIRTAHAVRSMQQQATEVRRQELARALAYWASHTRPLLGDPGEGRGAARAALKTVPLLPPELRQLDRGPSDQRIAEAQDDPAFGRAIQGAGPAAADHSSAFASDLLDTASAVFVQNGATARIFFLHAVTAAAAVDVLLPHLDEPARVLACRHAWQLVAAIQSRFGDEVFRGDDLEAAGADADELSDAAVANGDEHAIKLTSACVVAWRREAQPVLLLAAARELGVG